MRRPLTMQEERKRILDMVENGTITAQEALALLEELGKQATIVTPQVNTQKFEEEKKTEQVKQGSADFIEDLKRDFTMVGDRFMQFMQGTVDKMKDFEFEMKFNDPVTFEEKFVKQDVQFDDISINLTNGKVNIFPSAEPFAHATVKAKSFKNSTEEEARKRFQEEFIFTTEGNKLRVYSDMKTISVQVALFVPEKEYNHISARLFNGDFVAQNLEANTFKIKTTNGKVELENSKFHRADIETVNGSVQLQHVEGDTVEVETMNGRIYVDGKLKEIEGSSVSGHVILTTKDKEARKIEGTAVAGTVEIYVPKDISLKGETTTQLGRIDVQLTDVTQINQSEQVLNKRVAFTKVVDSEKEPLRIYGDAKTGSVVVRYTTEA